MSVRQYIGARYVPKFVGQWDANTSYESLSIVLYGNSSYTSKVQVPAGIAPTNTEYWAMTGNFNGFIEDLNNNVSDLKNSISSFENVKLYTQDNGILSSLPTPDFKMTGISKGGIVMLNINPGAAEAKSYDLEVVSDLQPVMNFVQENSNIICYGNSNGAFTLSVKSVEYQDISIIYVAKTTPPIVLKTAQNFVKKIPRI